MARAAEQSVRYKMKLFINVIAASGLLFFSDNVLASNFGDLPSVIPVFIIFLLGGIFAAYYFAFEKVGDEEDEPGKSARIGCFVVLTLLAVVFSLIVLVVMWWGTY